MSTALIDPAVGTGIVETVDEEVTLSALDSVPEHIRQHIRDITATSGLENSDDSVEKIASGWLEKMRIFEDRIVGMEMAEVETLPEDTPEAILALTWSGSIVTIGPLQDGKRRVEYTSIGLRSDVPESAVCEESLLSGALETDSPISFKAGPVKSTSPIHKIAVCSSEMDSAEQEETVNHATQTLKEDFVRVNRTIIL